jgi:hypothetical protein
MLIQNLLFYDPDILSLKIGHHTLEMLNYNPEYIRTVRNSKFASHSIIFLHHIPKYWTS